MTDTGQVPGEGLPENAGMVEQPGAPAPDAYTFLDPSENHAEDDDLLLMPGAQGAWGNEVGPPAPQPLVHEPGPHETAGRDSGSVDLSAVRGAVPAAQPATPRRPLHLGPPTPDVSAGPVRSLADRGPASAPLAAPAHAMHPATPVRHAGPPTAGPEYLDVPQLSEIPPQGAVPWGAPAAGPEPTAEETVVPAAGQGSEAGFAAGPETAFGAAPTPDEAPESAGSPLAHQAMEEAGHAELASPLAVDAAAADAALAHAPAVPEADRTAEAAQDHLAHAGAEAEQGPEAVHAPDGSLDFQTPQTPDAASSFTAAGDVPHTEPAADAAAEQVSDAHAAEHADAPAGVAVDEGNLTPDQASRAAQDQAAQDQLAQDAAAPQDQAAHQTAPAVADPSVHLADPAGHLTDQAVHLTDQAVPFVEQAAHAAAQAARFPDRSVRFVDAGVHIPESAAQFAEVAAGGRAGGAEGGFAGAAQPASAPHPHMPSLTHEPAEARTPAADDLYGQAVPGVGAFPVQAAQFVPPAEAHAAFAEAAAGVAAHGETSPAADHQPHADASPAANPPHDEDLSGETRGEAGFPSAPAEPSADDSLGRFVPVDGQVPTTPHLAPTPPHAMTVPPLPAQEWLPAEEPGQEQAPVFTDLPEAAPGQTPEAPAHEEEPVAPVPAPREAEELPVPEPLDADPDPVVAQQAEDLDTQVADQEESTAAVEDVRESTGPAAPGYDDAEREAVLRVMRERRDIRNGFRNDPIPHDVLLRVLEAAHTAPSVGHSQPWDFVVIRSAETRRTMHELAARQREAYAKSLPKGRAKQFKELKIEAILDTPVNIVVTADPTRGGRHTLGRHTQPQMAPYSSALAVQNLWLAARAEGLGVGWVSFFDEREMVRALGLPEHLDVVAYLCVGYVDEFPEEPELMQAGWSKRRPLSWVVHEETYGRRALPGEEPHDLLAETVSNIRPLDAKALGEAWERQKRMTKPAGALGMLEIISAQLSGLSRMCPPPIPEPAAVAIFAGDHGVHAQGVTPWPQEVTAQMVANFLGGGAVCNAFANQVGAEVCVVDVGVASDLPATPGLLPRKVRAGTADMTTGPAMTREEVTAAIEVGIETARDLVAAGNKALLTGEMGIANTTASAALISVFTGADPSEVTGRGTGINDETLARKTEVVRRAIELHQPDPADPIGVLAAIGGLEHAAMVGLLLGGASLRTPVILDGVSAGAAALVARAIAPEVLAACIAGHRSAEPGHVAALNKLGLRPLIDLDLRLGEGTGALLALPVVQSAARAMHEVATFDSAGVTEK
ncbi:nicotinate-nucleotide--dimethylbenzimidazole phosphoribosyltransferase [Streptomyces sp. NBC_01176]|uniref:nicotinate-nucleotide--dimethylbenzimidazole phosphoribosyltransferase n=1 Tax=Streptomyces sp. NBC_01176 TaxID=2903760 RepID=UPI003870E3C4|nr:nicotinate-nucleotide--dimethylbenzimidazole phosphoribosyltransferase [Streptomyces sp. NBC_01176]